MDILVNILYGILWTVGFLWVASSAVMYFGGAFWPPLRKAVAYVWERITDPHE